MNGEKKYKRCPNKWVLGKKSYKPMVYFVVSVDMGLLEEQNRKNDAW